MKITWKRRDHQITVGRFNLHFVGLGFVGAGQRVIMIGSTRLYCLPGLRLFVKARPCKAWSPTTYGSCEHPAGHRGLHNSGREYWGKYRA